MKLLIIISNHFFGKSDYDNIKCLNDYMKNNSIEIDYCGISNQNDFDIYESIIQFKYKIINTKKQLSKICDFITEYKSELDYDWYLKIRPEIKLCDNIDFNMLSENAINARARVYNGPRTIKYGMSVNGEGCWKNIGDCHYADREHNIILDDMIYIFHKNIVQKNAFEKIPIPLPYNNAYDIEYHGCEFEWLHTDIFNQRKIPLNVIGINVCFTKNGSFSGNINME
jgi:hypothetical protein